MPLALLLGLAASAWAGPEDAEALVSKLASPRAAERDAAERALRGLGDAALPALARVARTSDLELRGKVAALRDGIEGAGLVRPTLVKLDLDRASPKEAAAAIASQAGSVILVEIDEPRAQGVRPPNRSVTIRARDPIPLWEALDALAAQVGLRLDPAMNPMMRQRQVFLDGQGRRRRAMSGNELVFRPADDAPAAPTSDWGAVRTSLVGLRVDRARNFARTPETPGQPEATSVFAVTLQVRGEPRISIASVDDARIDVAVDDRGQSLAGDGRPAPPNPIAQGAMNDAGRPQPIVLNLRYPDAPGASIARLRGSYRALVVGRRGESLGFPLAGSVGKSFTRDEATVTVHQVGLAPGGAGMVVEMSVKLGQDTGQPNQFFNPGDPRSSLRPPPSARGQIEFLDAQGRSCQMFDLGSMMNAYGGFNPTNRLSLTVPSAEGGGPPSEARYYPVTWTSLAVPFDFRDIPMP